MIMSASSDGMETEYATAVSRRKPRTATRVGVQRQCTPSLFQARNHPLLAQVLEAMGQKPTEEELFQMISEVDDNMSGSIDFPEFLKVRGLKIKRVHYIYWYLLRLGEYIPCSRLRLRHQTQERWHSLHATVLVSDA